VLKKEKKLKQYENAVDQLQTRGKRWVLRVSLKAGTLLKFLVKMGKTIP
jgi:hypothetical protein